MSIRLRIKPLDRYAFSEFWRIFATTALGFPILVIAIDLTDRLSEYLSRDIPPHTIALAYVYMIPGAMFMVLPAAVLFAIVFSIGAFTRYSEITAAKASGISFYRLTAPLFVAAASTVVIGLVLGEAAPRTNAKHDALLREQQFRGGNERYNFAYAAQDGRVYQVGSLNAPTGTAVEMEIERKGIGPSYPTYMLTAARANWNAKRGWKLVTGTLHIMPDSVTDVTVQFDSASDRHMTEIPTDLMAAPRNPDDMGYRDLKRFIAALQRSGGSVDELRVELAQKIAIPITCIIIALFGAPLATSTQRGGAAYGIAISLATTVIFLMMIQLTKAVGAKGIIQPEMAAWVPNILFALTGLILLVRVRT